MSENDKVVRDSKTGQYVRKAAETAHRLHTVDDSNVHPMAKILFGWTEYKHIGNILFGLVGGLSLVLIAMDFMSFLVKRKETVEVANLYGFYALWGFGAFAFVVLMGWPLGKLLRRGEDYYGDAGGPPADIDPLVDLDDVSASHDGEAD